MSHHHHDHASEQAGPSIPFSEKAKKLIAHWTKHNRDHAQSYRQWAEIFRQNGLGSAANELESAAELTEKINGALVEASRRVD